MPRLTLLLVSLMLGAGCAVVISSCGGDDGPGIPVDNSDQVLAELDRARASLAAGDCDSVAESAEDIQANIDAVDEPLDPTVREGIEQGTARLAELAQDPTQCEPTTTTTDEDETETEPTTTTTPTTTEETTTTTTEEEEEKPPKEEEEDDDSGPPGQPPGPPGGGGPPPTGGTGDGD
jgi:hypothetical protein